MSTLTRVPPNVFAIPFGLVGLAFVWRLMAGDHGSPPAVADVLFLTAAAVWTLPLAGGIARLLRAPRALLGELRDPVLGPFWAIPWIVGMLLALGLQPHAPRAAKPAFLLFLAVTVLFGGWLTGEWIAGPLEQRKLHPGYLLPTVAGGLVGAQCAASFDLRGLGWLCLGIGVVCWLVLGSLILNRLLFLEMLPAALVPTLAIELAPAAVGGNAYFSLDGGTASTVAYGLAGYTVLMVLVQLRLLALFVRLRFSPGLWAFTFSWCAVAMLALRWLQLERPAGSAVYAALTAGAVSGLVGAIAVRSVVAIARGEFLPSPVAPVSRAAPIPAGPAGAGSVPEVEW